MEKESFTQEWTTQKIQTQSYVVRIFFRDFYDRKKGRYDLDSPDNKSGLNKNVKWDSIYMLLLPEIYKHNPLEWWFNKRYEEPTSMVIKFKNYAEAKAFNKEITINDYSFIVQESRIEKYNPYRRFIQ